MKAVLMAFSPKECEKIFSGEKLVDVRKVAPKLETSYKVYMYQTKEKGGVKIINDCLNSVYGGGKVVGEWVCDEKHDIQFAGASYTINNDISLTNRIARQSCLQYDDMFSYLGVKGGAALHITKPKLYDKPKKLGEFRKPCEYASEHYACYPDNCARCPWNTVTRPPQSFMYVEEIEE